MEIDGGFAVYPKANCPHIGEHVGDFPSEHTVDIPGVCQICEDNVENWMCCKCFLTFCSRHRAKHMIVHADREDHKIALSFTDLSFWCYNCESYIEHNNLKRIFTSAHVSKFGVLPGAEAATPEERTQALKAAFGVTTSNTGRPANQVSAFVAPTVDEGQLLPVGNITGNQIKGNRRLDAILGVIYGHALGDAVGLSTEFCTKADVNTIWKGEAIPFPDFQRTMHSWRWKMGDWTDDTDQMILIIDMLLAHKGVNRHDFAKRLLDWSTSGFPELGDTVGLGLGSTTAKVFQQYEYLEDPHTAARKVWETTNKNAAPNGAVMRTDVLGCWQCDDMVAVIQNTLECCKVTHYDGRCQYSCLVVTLLVRRLILMDVTDITTKKIENILSTEIYPKCKEVVLQLHPDMKEILEEESKYTNVGDLGSLELDEGSSIGYTLKTLGAALWAVKQTQLSFTDITQAIASEAGDADTNAAVAGGLVGARIGYSNLPMEWLRHCPHKAWLDNKVEQLVYLMGVCKPAAKATTENH